MAGIIPATGWWVTEPIVVSYGSLSDNVRDNHLQSSCEKDDLLSRVEEGALTTTKITFLLRDILMALCDEVE